MSVVVAYHPSEQGRAALRAGLDRARALRAPLVVASHAYLDADAGRTAAAEDVVLRELDALGEGRAGLEIRVHESAEPDVGEFVLAVASEEGAALVVIGLRGKSPIGKLNLGAAARRVLLASPCPVLAAKDTPATVA